MRETFEDYLQRLKDRRTEDDYKYTDEDFKNYIHYIFNCYETNLSVYKCLEFMYFAERDIDDTLFNREPIEELGILEVPMPIQKEEKRYSEEEVDSIIAETWNSCEDNEGDETFTQARGRILNQYKHKQESTADYIDRHIIQAMVELHRQEQHDFLPGFINQFDPKEGEINGEEWTAVQFLKWLELNKFKIIK